VISGPGGSQHLATPLYTCKSHSEVDKISVCATEVRIRHLLQAWSGLEGSRRLMRPYFKTVGT
jgi:hypothetical protein